MRLFGQNRTEKNLQKIIEKNVNICYNTLNLFHKKRIDIMAMKTFPADEAFVRTQGRSITEKGVRYLDYTCSFIEFEFTGTYAAADIISDLMPDSDIFRAWAAVFIDDEKEPSKRFRLDSKKERVEFFRAELPRRVRIRLMKLSEAAFAKMDIIIDGEIHTPPCPKTQRRIEFVGDSITCGYGIDGIWNKDTFSTDTEAPLKGFAYKTAAKCCAEYQYVSWSGIGVLSAWVDENAEKPLDNWLMRDIYPYTDSGLENTLGREGHENHEKWDFSRYVPQVIVFNIGTNDHSWTKGLKDRQEDFRKAYREMLETIRKNNPGSHIICTYGVMGTTLLDAQRETVKEFAAETGDSRIEYIPLPVQDEADGIGADWHPSEKTHEKMSDILSTRINKIFEEQGL